jgi:DNA-binding beta-propeller fold protein YncE
MKQFLPLVLGLALLSHAGDARASGLLLVCNKGDHALGIIDPAEGRQIAEVAEDGTTGHEVIASTDGKRAFVPIYGNAGVGKAGTDGSLLRVIDLAAQKIVGTVDFGKGIRPHCPMIGPKDGLLYVTTEIDRSVTVIDPATLKIVGRIPTGQPESHMLAISSDGKRGYTANVGPGTVSVLNMETRQLIAVIPVCRETQRIALSTDNHWAFTSDQDEPRLAVIDTKHNRVSKWIPLPGRGYGAAATPDGRWLLIAIPKEHRVAVIDVHSMQVARSIAVPASPQETLVRPDGAEAYVSCDVSKQVAVINLKDWTVSKVINAGAVADGLAWANAQ